VLTCGRPEVIDARGLRLRLHHWGTPGDAPVLLLHSMGAHGHWWDWTAPFLSGTRHVVALDFRGHGESARPEPPAYAFADHVADALATLDTLGWTAPLVIGHSLGGYIGASLAAAHPERVGRLVIADMLTFWTEDMAARGREQAGRAPQRLASAAEVAARFRLTPQETGAPAEWLRHLGEAGAVERSPGAWEASFDRRALLHPPIDPWPALPAVRCPTLVVRGEHSPLMDRAQMLRVATTVNRGKFAEIPGAYHHLVLDDPPAFAAVVERWLA
jgi:pimeloyl-ACP methyl ester carboxylesterase